MFRSICFFLLLIISCSVSARNRDKLIPVGKGWAKNSVNTVVFRKNSLVSAGNLQFIAYYDSLGNVVLGKRKQGSVNWILKTTPFRGTATDAHNSISIMVDGDGYLHLSWDHHGNPLRYSRSKMPYSLEMGVPEPMTGEHESNVTYPEFYKMPDGSLVFMYRDGSSGKGNLVLNKYDLKSRRWMKLQQNLIDGQGNRNAYCQAYVDNRGTIHLSWVWRESWLVETNHDMCYARSEDGGVTWVNSQGRKYNLPITIETAEYACRIPENSELINQTSMTSDEAGHPYIATYYREKDSDIPQYHIIYHNGHAWKVVNPAFRKTSFSLKGGGTKRIPISRPQLISTTKSGKIQLKLIFRDEERNSKVSVASCENLDTNHWSIRDLTDFSVGSWEPSFDTELWRTKGKLNLFVQNTDQADGEGKSDLPPQTVFVLENR